MTRRRPRSTASSTVCGPWRMSSGSPSLARARVKASLIESTVRQVVERSDTLALDQRTDRERLIRDLTDTLVAVNTVSRRGAKK